MRWQDIDKQVCSVARALAIVGDRWTLLVLRDAFLGTRRFEDFQRQLGVSRHRLADRLNKLVSHGLLLKVKYQERPARFEYRLTPKGVDIYPVLVTLAQWGDQWCDDGNGAPVQYLHRSCGNKTRALLTCSECGDALLPQEVAPVPGPGLKAAVAAGTGMYVESQGGGEMVDSLPPLLRTALPG